MGENRDAIPEEIRREVRRSCGFGCAICGLPIYDYDHIIEYSEVKEHKLENLVLLCPNHHRSKNKTIPLSEIQKAKNDPINLRTGTTLPEMINFRGNKIDVFIGSNHYSKVFDNIRNETYPLVIDNIPVISFRKDVDKILLSITIYNSSNEPLLIIEDNEMIMSTIVWDITYIGNTLRIDSNEVSQAIVIHFDVNRSVVSLQRANYSFNNWHITIDSKGEVLCTSPEKMRGFSGVSGGNNPNASSGFVIIDYSSNTGFLIGEGDLNKYKPLVKFG